MLGAGALAGDMHLSQRVEGEDGAQGAAVEGGVPSRVGGEGVEEGGGVAAGEGIEECGGEEGR